MSDAIANAAANGLAERSRYVAGRAEEALPALIFGGGTSSTSSNEENEVAAWLKGRLATPGAELVAVVDPPRTGMAPAVCASLRRCEQVSRLVYVCCNPGGNFARWDYVVRKGSLQDNAALLCAPEEDLQPTSAAAAAEGGEKVQKEATGRPFAPVWACAVDIFPHTPHCELVAVFER